MNDMDKSKITNKNWTRFNKYLYKYWKIQSIVIVAGLISIPTKLLNPYLTKLVIDKAYGNKDLKLFFVLAAVGAAVFIVNGLIGAGTKYFSRIVNRNVHFDMTKDLFDHLQNLPMGFFDNHSTGEHIYRINADVRSVSEFVCNTIPQMITLIPRLIFILAIVFHLNWKLSLLAACLVPITYIQPIVFGRLLKEISRKTVLRSQGIFKELQEVFSHIKLIKAMGREKHEMDKFRTNIHKRKELELKNAKVSNVGTFIGSLLNKVLSGTIALYGGYQVVKGTLSLGSLTAIMIYLTQMIGILKSVGQLYQTITINSVTRHRLSEILDIKKDKDIPYKEMNLADGRIEFKGVTFGYKKNKKVIDNLNFAIMPSEKTALIGPSGCGKTTLILLILKLYVQDKGKILVDNINTKDINAIALRNNIGVALQEPYLWNESIRHNIVYGKIDSDSDGIETAARISEAHDFIMNLPNGYDSVIGEMACKLSQGQKQRISVARAVIKKPKILILDEALSSVDSETEDKIIKNIKKALPDSVIIAVSHRLSTVKNMDTICFLQNGANVIKGPHEELFKNCGRYKELFSSQMTG